MAIKSAISGPFSARRRCAISGNRIRPLKADVPRAAVVVMQAKVDSLIKSAEGGDVQLLELLGQVEQWNDEDTTIYVAPPWSCESEAMLISPAPDTTEPVERNGRRYEYFLETFLAREFLEGYAASAEGASASEEQRCKRLLRYAEQDA